MRKALALATAVTALSAIAATATPAHAVDGTTTVALTVVDGVLAITTTPAAAGVQSEFVGTDRVLTAPLGVTTISDTRVASSSWTLTASTTIFTNTVAGATIPASNAKFYVQADPQTTLGTVNSYDSTTTPDASGALVTADTSGVNVSTVTPVLQVLVPATAAAGLYTGTVTQSVV